MADPTCAVRDCERESRTASYCAAHYKRWQVHGDATVGGSLRSLPKGSPEERFWARVVRDGECWIWTGQEHSHGYGMFQVDRKRVYAHRFSYELHIGPIPVGLQIDHLCRRPPCVNPDHLEAVTPRTNTRRGVVAEMHRLAAKARATCGKGHLWAFNEYLPPDGSPRQCRECKREAHRRRRHRRNGRAE